MHVTRFFSSISLMLLAPLPAWAFDSTCQDRIEGQRDDVVATAPAAVSAVALLPPMTRDPAHPWIPYAAEKELGATWCPSTENQDRHRSDVVAENVPGRARTTGIMHKPCLGMLPSDLVDVLLAVPEKDIFIPAAERASALGEEQAFQAIPGHGSRPDILASVDGRGGIHIRSFEGRTAADTVYLVAGPFDCIDNKPGVMPEGSEWLDTPGCQDAKFDVRLYKWTSPGVLRDVTQQYLPAPRLSALERASIETDTFGLSSGVLSRVPVLRWTALLRNSIPFAENNDYEPIDFPAGISLARRGYSKASLHFGFVIWDGARFQTHQRVPRSLWPLFTCNRGRPDARCPNGIKTPYGEPDPSVDEDAATVGTQS